MIMMSRLTKKLLTRNTAVKMKVVVEVTKGNVDTLQKIENTLISLHISMNLVNVFEQCNQLCVHLCSPRV